MIIRKVVVLNKSNTATTMTNPKLHTRSTMRRTWFNRAFALAYMCSILALLHHHTLDLLHSTTLTSLLIRISDTILAFMWISYQAFRMNPICREVFIENLSHVVKDEREYPGLDVFICTADPFKEPPIGVVNTALSALAFEYPTDKLAVYVSDDGGSDLTLFAFMEAAKFAKYWLPFCKKNGIVERCPEAYFGGEPAELPETDNIKVSESWFLLYVFLFTGSNAQSLFEFMVAGGTFVRWWNNQRMWIIRGLSSFPFALLEYVLKSVGMSSFGYNVTSKVVDNEEKKHYEQGIFEFGVPSPMFLPLAMATIINLFSFSSGVLKVLKSGRLDDVFAQIFISGYWVVSCWPIYEAMVLRSDKGKMPVKITILATILSWILCTASSFAYSNLI